MNSNDNQQQPDPVSHGDNLVGSQPASAHGVSDKLSARAPVFSDGMFRRQLILDSLIRGLFLSFLIVVLFIAATLDKGDSIWWLMPLIIAMLAWLSLNNISARTSRLLPHLTMMVESDPEAAESQLAYHLRYRPLLRWLRLLLYHRLAMLRHRQGRYDEVAAICSAILNQPLGPAGHSRPNLLLLFTESCLQRGDLHGAYAGLIQLYWTPMNLIEALQRLALQTRYEVMAGHYHVAIQRIWQKVQMAEIMPPVQCGIVHAMLATAASGANEKELARWLWQRVNLLCTARQIEELKTTGFAAGPIAIATGMQAVNAP